MGKQYYIKLNGELIPVSEEVYRAYHQPEWREKKQIQTRRGKEISYDEMSDNELMSISDVDEQNVERIVINDLLIDDLHRVLYTLTNEEQFIIKELFFNDKSERKLSKETGIPQKSINNKKHEIIKKLKKLL